MFKTNYKITCLKQISTCLSLLFVHIRINILICTFYNINKNNFSILKMALVLAKIWMWMLAIKHSFYVENYWNYCKELKNIFKFFKKNYCKEA